MIISSKVMRDLRKKRLSIPRRFHAYCRRVMWARPADEEHIGSHVRESVWRLKRGRSLHCYWGIGYENPFSFEIHYDE